MCYYQTRRQCGSQYSGNDPPVDWKNVICDVCERVVGHACPLCAMEEDCLEGMCSECHRIPPPTTPSPDDARRQEQLRRSLQRGSEPPRPSRYPNYWPLPGQGWP